MKKHKFDIEDKKEAIKKEILRLSVQLNKTPTMKDYKKYAENDIGLEQVTYLFGKWSEAIKFSGLTPNPFNIPPRQPEISKESLIQEFIRVSNEIGKIPGKHAFRSKSKYSWTPYKTKWGSWRNAVDNILENHKAKLSFSINHQKVGRSKKSGTKRLLYTCPLQYEPRNELETIVLFAYLSRELGYRIKEIKSAFPDAVLEKDGEVILAEFEFLSSNYIGHCHPDNKKYLCICWRQDIELKETPIFSLEKYIRNRNAL
jgi:hypothetical protein